MNFFECVIPGKWILAGEHAVLRGCPALVFPFYNKNLSLQYRRFENKDLKIHFKNGSDYELLFLGALEKACELTQVSRSQIVGEIQLACTLPLGAGLGASAALCVAIARWFHFLGFVGDSDVFELAKNIENLFHGESSGVDVAVSLHQRPLKFTRGQPIEFLNFSKNPHLYISYSGQRGITMDCVNQVKNFLLNHPERGNQIDQMMSQSVELAVSALVEANTENLMQSMLLAQNCFSNWGLLTPQLLEHMEMLENQGALAVKPTGSGGGGYVLSLWRGEPPSALRSALDQVGFAVSEY